MKAVALFRIFSIFLVLVFGIALSGHATHLRAGEIIVTREDCSSLVFTITVTVFTNTDDTNILFGGEDDWLDFGDGNRILVPETPNTRRPDLGEGIGTASFTIRYTYSGPGVYIVSYSEPNRNNGVLNMDSSVTTRFYIETQIIVDPFLDCNNTPRLLVPPIDRACSGVAWFHNPGAYDPDDGDSLSFELVVPYREKNTTVVNYRDPNHPKFYVNYNNGSENGGPPIFNIDPVEGTLTWDAPGAVGEYNIAFVIREWRKKNGKWVPMGYVRRDMQIIVDDCKNERPDLIIPEDVCVEAGSTLDATILGIDPDNDPVMIEAFSEIFNYAPNQFPATFTPNPPGFQPSNPPAKLNFQWKTDCMHIQEQPYQVVFKITDKSPTGSKLVTFKSWFIRVVGPEPEWNNASLDMPTRSATLEWDPYFCLNAEKIQVWRRVGSFEFEPDSCQTGMPESLGFSLIAEVPVKDQANNPVTSYVDTNNGEGLASGAEYCYRLLAVYPLPKGGESYVSKEICIGPILADKPVITNVTVDLTSTSNGQITVRWREPFEADPAQFPPPYQYEVFRAEGFSGDFNLVKVGNRQSELFFVDSGLNTETRVYNYRILAYDANNNPLDTSDVASSVRLEAQSQLQKIELTWRASVPWSNHRQEVPNKHLIYRGPEGVPDDQLVLIDSVDVFLTGFRYVDEGPLEINQAYCYKIMTRGGYGNPEIAEPLINFSQKVCAFPGDEDPPCAPQLHVQLLNCEELSINELCNANVFSNTLYWNRPDDLACALDIVGYRVYRSNTMDGQYSLLSQGIVTDTFFIDNNIESYAYCYKITSVDRSGNESDLSESQPACNDNCPYYELPNVFTPNGDDCNDYFSAYSDNDRYRVVNEGGVIFRCGGVVDETKCARFVERVRFKVYNRWGKEVFTYDSGIGDRSIYIDWDGRGADGTLLASGIYFYVADVTFDTVDPAKREKTIKGWVHLIR